MFCGGPRAAEALAVTFWSAGNARFSSVRREITTPTWDEVSGNYEHHTARELASLVGARIPASGRLVLWHGAPGTGKTTALRALARAWAKWCEMHFITDPEAFLGAGTAYLLDVLTAGPSQPAPDAPHWRMVVLEDAGELLSVDARARAGQALSRLLNVSDGVLGQGTKVVLLVTTNEPLGHLHPAVTRPGRCWRTIEFQALGVTQANAWLAAHHSSARVAQAATLAELYDTLRGHTPAAKRAFGFGGQAS
jgi:hypothetical protein